MTQLPATFQQALQSGYRVTHESSRVSEPGKRAGTVRLKKGSRPELTVQYEADRRGYKFSKPEKAMGER